jgi:hypothetical protein
LPEEITDVFGHVVGIESFSAKLPVRSQEVAQTPALQMGVPPFAGQIFPHMPQLLGVLSAVSQPLTWLPSQLA